MTTRNSVSNRASSSGSSPHRWKAVRTRTSNSTNRPPATAKGTKNQEHGRRPSPMKIERFEDIEGWQIGRELTKEVYAATAVGPFARDFGLRDQIQRAAGS